MPASTITRATWTDDDGTGTTGTILNNARLQADVYDKIDQLFSGAGSYTTLFCGGKVWAEGGVFAFPVTPIPSTGVNELDDYRENTWTPALSSASGSGITYSNQTGSVIKIGKLVIVSFSLTLSSLGTASGAITLTGLPYTVENIGAGVLWNGHSCDFSALTTNAIHIGVYPTVNTTTASFSILTAAGTTSLTGLVAADLSATSILRATCAFRASV